MEGVIKSKSKTFVAFCFCFLTGVFVVSVMGLQIDGIYPYALLFVLIVFSIAFWQKIVLRFFLLCLIFFTIGIFRYFVSFPMNTPEHISYYNGERQEIIGHVVKEPDVRLDGVQYVVRTTSLLDKQLLNKETVKENIVVKGNILVKSDLYPRYEYGDVVSVECDLIRPEPIESFRYDMYLAVNRVFSICNNPVIGLAEKKEGSILLSQVFRAKNRFANMVNRLWHEPYASFMAGLLYGYRGGLGGLNELFHITGVTHIIAISGYNITIIASILMVLCINILCIPRKKAFWIISTGIVVFVFFAGASASVVRAGIMGILVLLSRQLGRSRKMGNILTCTAALMVFFNPFVLVWDTGFQLSFTATLGLVYIAPIFEERYAELGSYLGIKDSIINTMSAIVATLPLVLFQFGRLSIVAPLANLLILWTIPWIMMFGFVAVIGGLLFYPFGLAISWIALIGLKYIVYIIEKLGSLAFAAVDFQISWWFMAIMYFLLVYFTVRVKKRTINLQI